MEHVHIFSQWDLVYKYNLVFQQKTGANSKGPTIPYMPVAADLSGRRYGKGKKSSSRLSQQTAASETRGNGNSQQKRSAYTRRIKECPTDNSTEFNETLGELLK